MMYRFPLALLISLVLLSSVHGEEPLHIKLGTIAPNGTSLHRVMRMLEQDWEKTSKGRVKVTVYAGGIQGGELAMAQRLKLNSLQGGLFTASGLGKLEPRVNGLQSVPMIFRSLEEKDYVVEKLGERLEKMLAEKGLVVLAWSDAGWARWFTNVKAVTPDDMRKLNVYTWVGDPESQGVYRSVEFKAVPLDTGEILTGLKTGLIDAIAMPPFAANAMQVYRETPHMLDLDWGIVVGAIVLNKETWEKIPADLRAHYLKSAKGAGKVIQALGRKEAAQSIKTMKSKWGLQVHSVDEATLADWREASERTHKVIRGGLVPEEIFDALLATVKEYRESKGGE
ncbi:TRAP transporter substrate-binding protein DctP [Verrucomicrobia bacterium]|nr:TRAP transporter substrate-binding protein DctP [Verrucomicrobiota bacterium]